MPKCINCGSEMMRMFIQGKGIRDMVIGYICPNIKVKREGLTLHYYCEKSI